MPALRIGFCGGGMVSELHAAAIRNSKEATLAGIFDPDEAVAAQRSALWGCRSYGKLEDLLASSDIDAVFVLSPTGYHVQQAMAALEAGKHVLVEKPVGRSPEEIELLLEAARKSRRLCIPGHNYAYIPEYQRIRRLVAEGALGDIRLLAIFFAIAHDEAVAAHYDGVVQLVLPHHVYLVHGLAGLPARVDAGVTKPAWRHLKREDQGWIVLDYPPLGTAILFATLGADDDSADPWTFIVKVVGSRGSASASWRAGVIKRAIGSMSTGYVPYEEAYERELAAFVAAVKGDPSAVSSTLEDALAVARILGAAETSIRTGRPTSLHR
jgi:predicted dehydrogenase